MLFASERACLAVVLDRNDLADVLFENLTREHFHGTAAIVFSAMQELAGDGMDLKWPTVRDACSSKVEPGFWQVLLDSTRGLHPSGAEAFLREKVQAIKAEAAKRKLLSEVSQFAGKPVLEDEDIDRLEKTAQAMRLVDRPKESHNLGAALLAYQEHIRQAASEITLGLGSLDRQIDGFNPGELVTIMARSGVGKTFAALNIIHHLAGKVPYKMALFSLEMPKAAIIERLLEIYFFLSRHAVKDRAIEETLPVHEFEQHFAQLEVYDKIYSVSEIRKIVEREGYRIIFIDFLHLVRPEVIGTPYQQISQIIAHLKQMAKDTGSVAFLLHQLSRQAGNGWERVEVSHARDSGQIEELSDFLIGISDPGLAPNAPAALQDKLTFRILKNKRGARWVYDVHFDKSCGRITEIAKEDDDGPGHGTEKSRRGLRDWGSPGDA